MSVRAYAAHRESAPATAGFVPPHWPDTRIRFLAQMNPSKSELTNVPRDQEVSFLPMDAIGEDGSLRLDATRELAMVEQGYTYFRDGDVVIAKITPCFENGKGALLSGLHGGIGFGTTELIVVRPKSSSISGVFLQWLFTSRHFRDAATASMYGAGGQKRVPDDFVRDFVVALPTLSEQSAIAAFLDRETGKIDALVAEQERLIALLKEKRQAVISEVVTKGLDPNVAMKDSGVEWLGKVPAHWQVARLGSIFVEAVEEGDADLPVLSVSIHDGVSDRELSDEEMDQKVTRSEDRSKYKKVQPDDLVYNMMRAWQGGFGSVAVAGMVSPAYVVARPRSALRTEFVELLLRTSGAVEEMRRSSKGVTDFRLRLYWDEFKQIRVALPPLEEQMDVLIALNTMRQRVDGLVDESERAIKLLRERRTALISAAVTGKIDVRDHAATDQAAAA